MDPYYLHRRVITPDSFGTKHCHGFQARRSSAELLRLIPLTQPRGGPFATEAPTGKRAWD